VASITVVCDGVDGAGVDGAGVVEEDVVARTVAGPGVPTAQQRSVPAQETASS